MPFNRPNRSDLVERVRGDIETRLPGADSRLRHSVLDVQARAHAGATDGLHGHLDFLARQLMPDTAEAGYLNRWAGIWGVRRKAAVPAVVQATVTGSEASPVPAGSELARSDGARYLVTAATEILGGTATLTIEASTAGIAGDLLAGTALTFTSPVPGVSARATVTALITPGADEEDDTALLARLLDRIQMPPQGGNAHDYVQWALAQPGVTRAWCYPQHLGLGTVGLSFVMDARPNIVPLAGDVAAVQAALDPLRPVTADLTVFAPATEVVEFEIKLTPDTVQGRAVIVAELADFFAREAEPGGTLYRSRMIEALSLAQGEHHHELHLPSGDVKAKTGTLPVLGTVSFVGVAP